MHGFLHDVVSEQVGPRSGGPIALADILVSEPNLRLVCSFLREKAAPTLQAAWRRSSLVLAAAGLLSEHRRRRAMLRRERQLISLQVVRLCTPAFPRVPKAFAKAIPIPRGRPHGASKERSPCSSTAASRQRPGMYRKNMLTYTFRMLHKSKHAAELSRQCTRRRGLVAVVGNMCLASPRPAPFSPHSLCPRAAPGHLL